MDPHTLHRIALHHSALRLLLPMAGLLLTVFSFQAWAQDAASTDEEVSEDASEGQFKRIPGGETSEGFTLSEVPMPELEGLEATVTKQLESLAKYVAQLVLKGEAQRNDLGEAFAELGQVFHAYEFYDSAKPCYENAILLLPGDGRWQHLLGYVEQQRGNAAAAREQYELALGSPIDPLPTRLRLVELDIEENEVDRAARALEEILREHPEHLAARALMAEVDLAKADFDKAIAGFEAVLQAAPAANRYHYSLALAYRDNRNMEKANYHMSQRGEVGLSLGDTLVEGLEERKRGERVFLLRGRRAFGAGRYEEAAEAFEQAVAAEPTSARSRVNLGSALAASGQTAQAIEQFRVALELDPGNATAHYNLGGLLADNDPEKAIGHYRTAAEADPEDIGVRLQLARLLRRSNQSDEALSIYERVIELQPTMEEARLRQAGVLVDLGRFAEARQKLEEARLTMPQEGRLLRALAQLLAASPDLTVRDGEMALELSRSIWQASATPRHAEMLAQAYGELQKCEEAAAWQRVAIDMAGESADAARLSAMQRTLDYYKSVPVCRPPA